MYDAALAIAFPEDIEKRSVTLLPSTSVSKITAEGVRIFSTELEGVRVEQIDFRLVFEIYRRKTGASDFKVLDRLTYQE